MNLGGISEARFLKRFRPVLNVGDVFQQVSEGFRSEKFKSFTVLF